MAAIAVFATPTSFLSRHRHHHKTPSLPHIPLQPNKHPLGPLVFNRIIPPNCTLPTRPLSLLRRLPLTPAAASSDKSVEDDLSSFEDNSPLKTVFLVLLWASVSLAVFAFSKDAKAASDSIKASGVGVKVAGALRGSGWPDEAIVFALATLPVIELRGAIPVGYWMNLNPILLTVLSILGFVVYIFNYFCPIVDYFN